MSRTSFSAGTGTGAVFALHLNVTTGLVRQWERGEKQPSGASLKLLTLVARKGLQAVA
jgi:putative transcriptional regulator